MIVPEIAFAISSGKTVAVIVTEASFAIFFSYVKAKAKTSASSVVPKFVRAAAAVVALVPPCNTGTGIVIVPKPVSDFVSGLPVTSLKANTPPSRSAFNGSSKLDPSFHRAVEP